MQVGQYILQGFIGLDLFVYYGGITKHVIVLILINF